MSSDPTSPIELVKVMAKEGRRRVLSLSAMFSVTAVVALAVGMLLPKKYEASTLILVEANNIMKPLMEGRITPTTVADQTAVVNQLVVGKRVLREVLLFGGWVKPAPALQPEPREEERLLKEIRSRIRIDSTREELVRITFTDSDPRRCYTVANKLAEIYVRESDAGKERESREAFEFIDKQVKEYADKLSEIHTKVLAQYRGETKPATATPAAATPHAPATPKISAEELAELRTEEALLKTQVARKPPAPSQTSLREEEQARSRVLQLGGQLDQLRSTFTEEHPDVKRVKRELADAQAERDRMEKVAADRDASAKIDDDIVRAARARLDEVQRRIAEATGAPARRTSLAARTAQIPTTDPIDPDMRTVGRDTTLSELLRRYEATRDDYQDLLKRRENARVTMELDAKHRGFNMSVQELAEQPASVSGLRLMHLTLIGLFVALLVPLGYLALLVRFDRRVRSPQQISRLVPLLGSISYEPSHRERSRLRSREVLAVLMVGSAFVVYLVVFIIKLKAA